MSQKIDGELFSKTASYFCKQGSFDWSILVGVVVIDEKKGQGYISSVEIRNDAPPLFDIAYGEVTVTYNLDSFGIGNKQLIPNGALETLIDKWRAIEKKQKAVREAIELAQRQIKENFNPLASKYGVDSSYLLEGRQASPLCAILTKLESRDFFKPLEIEWLQEKELYGFLATSYYLFYKRFEDPWVLLTACKYWRKAHNPRQVISVTEGIIAECVTAQDNSVKKIYSALLTSRGGAFKDLKIYTKALKSASDAIGFQPNSYYPLNLLGAIYYEMGLASKGDQFFEKAAKLGSPRPEQDTRIKNSIHRSRPENRRKVVSYLLSKDPVKYAWTRKFAKI